MNELWTNEWRNELFGAIPETHELQKASDELLSELSGGSDTDSLLTSLSMLEKDMSKIKTTALHVEKNMSQYRSQISEYVKKMPHSTEMIDRIIRGKTYQERQAEMVRLKDDMLNFQFKLPDTEKSLNLKELLTYVQDKRKEFEKDIGQKDEHTINQLKSYEETLKEWIKLMEDPRTTWEKVIDRGTLAMVALLTPALLGGVIAVVGLAGSVAAPAAGLVLGVGLAVGLIGVIGYAVYKASAYVGQYIKEAIQWLGDTKAAKMLVQGLKDLGNAIAVPFIAIGRYLRRVYHTFALDNHAYESQLDPKAGYAAMGFDKETREKLSDCYANAVVASLIYDRKPVDHLNEDHYTQLGHLMSEVTLSVEDGEFLIEVIDRLEKEKREEITTAEDRYDEARKTYESQLDDKSPDPNIEPLLKLLPKVILVTSQRIAHLEENILNVEDALIHHGKKMTGPVNNKFMQIRAELDQDLRREQGYLLNLQKELIDLNKKQMKLAVAKDQEKVRAAIANFGPAIVEGFRSAGASISSGFASLKERMSRKTEWEREEQEHAAEETIPDNLSVGSTDSEQSKDSVEFSTGAAADETPAVTSESVEKPEDKKQSFLGNLKSRVGGFFDGRTKEKPAVELDTTEKKKGPTPSE